MQGVEAGFPYMFSSFLQTGNGQDAGRHNQPEVDVPLALCPFSDDDGNIAQSSYGQSASLAQFCSLLDEMRIIWFS